MRACHDPLGVLTTAKKGGVHLDLSGLPKQRRDAIRFSYYSDSGTVFQKAVLRVLTETPSPIFSSLLARKPFPAEGNANHDYGCFPGCLAVLCHQSATSMASSVLQRRFYRCVTIPRISTGCKFLQAMVDRVGDHLPSLGPMCTGLA